MTKTAPAGSLDDLFFGETVRRYVQAPRFIHRAWLADELLDVLSSPSCRIVVLTGAPGAGKSGFIAQLATDHPDWLLYMLRHDQRAPLEDGSARSFLLRIGFQLAALRPELLSSEQVQIQVEQRIGSAAKDASVAAAEVDRILTSPFHQAVIQVRQEVDLAAGTIVGLRVGEWAADPRLLDVADLAAMALLDPALTLARIRPDERIVILVDAVDELVSEISQQTLITWLTTTKLPMNVRVVVTSRPSDVFSELADRHSDAVQSLILASGDSRVRKDLTTYARELMRSENLRMELGKEGREPESFVRDLVEKANGNIGYLDALGRAFDRAESSDLFSSLLALDFLPDDLNSLYTYFLRRLHAKVGARMLPVTDESTGGAAFAEAWPMLYRPLLATLCVAFEPLTIDQLKGLSNTAADYSEVASAVQALAQFLDPVADGYRLYHATFVEFITADGTRAAPATAAFHVDLRETHERLARRQLADEAMWDDAAGSPSDRARRAYARRHLIAHLEAGEQWDLLFATIDDPAYVCAKARADSTAFMLCADLDAARRAAARDSLRQHDAIELLPRLWRYSLLRNSLARRADDYPDAAYVAIALVGRLTFAAQLAALITKPSRRACVLSDVAAALAANGRANAVAAFAGGAASAATQVTESSERVSTVRHVLARCRELSAAGARLDEHTLTLLETASEQIDGLSNRVAALAECVRVRALHADDAADKMLDGNLMRSIEEQLDSLGTEQVDIPERDMAIAEYVVLAVDLRDASAALERFTDLRNALAILRAVPALASLPGDTAVAVLSERLLAIEYGLPVDDAAIKTLLPVEMARGWAALGDTTRAKQWSEWAVSVFESAEPMPILAACNVMRKLARMGSQPLVARLAERLTLAGMGVPERERGWFRHPLYVEIVGALADVGAAEQALAVAREQSVLDHDYCLQLAASAFIREGAWDTALALANEAATSRQDHSLKVRIHGPVAPEVEIRHSVAYSMAERGEYDRALDVLSSLSDAEKRPALAQLAVQYSKVGDLVSSEQLIGEVEGGLRLTAFRSSDRELAEGALRIAIEARSWELAVKLSERVTYPTRGYLLDALLDAGEDALAVKVVDSLEEEQRVGKLIDIASRADASAEASLDQAIDTYRAIASPEKRARATLLLVDALAPTDLHRAHELLSEAVGLLQSIERFDSDPPWPQVCEAHVRVNELPTALHLASQLADWNSYVGAMAFRLIAHAAAELQIAPDVSDLLERADSLARAGRNWRTPYEVASVAVEFMRAGMPERAMHGTKDPVYGAAVRRALAAQLAEDGRALEAFKLLPPPAPGNSEPSAELSVLRGLLDAGELSKAIELARLLPQASDRAAALARAAMRAPIHEGRRVATEASSLLSECHGQIRETEAVEVVAECLVSLGMADVLIAEIHRDWRSASDDTSLARRILLAKPLVAPVRALAEKLLTSQAQVQTMLASI